MDDASVSLGEVLKKAPTQLGVATRPGASPFKGRPTIESCRPECPSRKITIQILIDIYNGNYKYPMFMWHQIHRCLKKYKIILLALIYQL